MATVPASRDLRIGSLQVDVAYVVSLVPAGPTVTVWNGTAEIAATTKVWNGTAEIAATIEVT